MSIIRTLVAAAALTLAASTASASTGNPILAGVGPSPAAPAVETLRDEQALSAYGAAVDRYTEAVRQAVHAAGADLATRTEVAAHLSRIAYEREQALAAFARSQRSERPAQVASR